MLNAPITLTQTQLMEFLLNVALVRPVFIWGPPGIGKSSLVTQFAEQLGLDCVSLLGSQLARAAPYCLCLDAVNACPHEVQKSFYSLIHERRIGEYRLPAGSIVIGAD